MQKATQDITATIRAGYM